MTRFSPTSPVRFDGKVADVHRDRSIVISPAAAGPPRRIDGYSIGVVSGVVGPGPHAGEVHPDGDELLYVVNGSMELILDDGDADAVGAETRIVLRTGDAYVVPRGVWHTVHENALPGLSNVQCGHDHGSLREPKERERK